MRLLPIALLCACTGTVTVYQDDTGDGGTEPRAPDATYPEPDSDATVEGEVPEPDCEGDAMCWPWGICDAGYCQWVDGGTDV